MAKENKGIPLGLNGRKVELFPCPFCLKTDHVGQLTFLNHGGTTTYFCSRCFIEFVVKNNKVMRVYDLRDDGEISGTAI